MTPEGERFVELPGAMERCPARRLVLACVLLALAACAKTTSEWRRDLSDPDPFVRTLGALAMSDIDPAGAMGALRVLLESFDVPDERVRSAVRRALLKAAPHHMTRLIESIVVMDTERQSMHEPVMWVLEQQGARAVVPLLAALRRVGGESSSALDQLLVEIMRVDPAARDQVAAAYTVADGSERARLAAILAAAGEEVR